MKRVYLFFALLLVSSVLLAQRTVQGVVMEEGEAAIPGVTVLVKDSTSRTVTDVDGNFTITLPQSQDVLIFSAVGYRALEV